MTKDIKKDEFALAGTNGYHSDSEIEKVKVKVQEFEKIAVKQSINERSKLRNPPPPMSLSQRVIALKRQMKEKIAVTQFNEIQKLHDHTLHRQSTKMNQDVVEA